MTNLLNVIKKTVLAMVIVLVLSTGVFAETAEDAEDKKETKVSIEFEELDEEEEAKIIAEVKEEATVEEEKATVEEEKATVEEIVDGQTAKEEIADNKNVNNEDQEDDDNVIQFKRGSGIVIVEEPDPKETPKEEEPKVEVPPTPKEEEPKVEVPPTPKEEEPKVEVPPTPKEEEEEEVLVPVTRQLPEETTVVTEEVPEEVPSDETTIIVPETGFESVDGGNLLAISILLLLGLTLVVMPEKRHEKRVRR